MTEKISFESICKEISYGEIRITLKEGRPVNIPIQEIEGKERIEGISKIVKVRKVIELE